MYLREAINKRPTLGFAVAAIVVLAAAAAVGYYLYQENRDPMRGSGSAFFSVDDGRTFFKDSSDKLAPFTHEGKQAVQAMVFTTDGGKTKFVGYLMRFTPRGVQIMEETRKKQAASGRSSRPSLDPELQSNTEVKKPGAETWVKMSDISSVAEVVNVRFPGDPARLADPIDP